MATIWSRTATGNDTGDSNFSFRMIATGLSAAGSYLRVTFAASTANTERINNASIGVSAGSGNTIATPVELKFGGVSGFSLGIGGSVTSDLIYLPFTAANNLVVIQDTGAAAGMRFFDSAGTDETYLKSGATFSSAAPGGLSMNNHVYGVQSIEGFRVSRAGFSKPIRFWKRRH